MIHPVIYYPCSGSSQNRRSGSSRVQKPESSPQESRENSNGRKGLTLGPPPFRREERGVPPDAPNHRLCYFITCAVWYCDTRTKSIGVIVPVQRRPSRDEFG